MRFVRSSLLILLALGLLALVMPSTLAQVAVTEEPDADQALQPIATPVNLPTPVLQPVQAQPTIIAPPFTSDVLTILINSRTDLEVLASYHLGTDRPDGWSANIDVTNPQLAILLRLDLDLLMAASVGLNNIPAGWFGAVPGTAVDIARDIRHDLELLADVLVEPNVRPPGWHGDRAIYRCDRSTQMLVTLLEDNELFTPNVSPTNPDFCERIGEQIGNFAITYLSNDLQSIANNTVANQSAATTNNNAVSAPSASSGTARTVDIIGLAFLDRYATQRVGTIPSNVPFTPVARSLTLFSRMTLVQGADFEVFVDYATTTITKNEFEVLPDVNSFPSAPFCGAAWCQDVRLIAGIGSSSRRLSNTGLVNAGTNMVIHYDGEDQNGQTKVRMELCDRPTSTGQAVCEPAIEVIRPDGSAAESVGSLGGLLQFYMPYMYSTTSVRSRNLYTIDLWIDPPGER